jgi:hypothetical protein
MTTRAKLVLESILANLTQFPTTSSDGIEPVSFGAISRQAFDRIAALTGARVTRRFGTPNSTQSYDSMWLRVDTTDFSAICVEQPSPEVDGLNPMDVAKAKLRAEYDAERIIK